jgi:hypothetical protein
MLVRSGFGDGELAWGRSGRVGHNGGGGDSGVAVARVVGEGGMGTEPGIDQRNATADWPIGAKTISGIHPELVKRRAGAGPVGEGRTPEVNFGAGSRGMMENDSRKSGCSGQNFPKVWRGLMGGKKRFRVLRRVKGGFHR